MASTAMATRRAFLHRADRGASPPVGSAAPAIWARLSSARAAGLFTAGGSTCQSSSARMWAKTPCASFSSSRASKVSAEAEAPKATRREGQQVGQLAAEAPIRLMASSRMSWAVGSSSRSRPETMALAGLMKSWHIRAAR